MIHVMFCSSAAGTLRQTLRAQGKRERVVELSEHLDWGPIGPIALFESRDEWLNRNIPWGGGRSWEANGANGIDMSLDWLNSGPRRFESKVENDPERLIWISPRSASELCGLYWYLDTFGGEGASMVVAGDPFPEAFHARSPVGLGELNETNIGILLDQAPREPWNANRFPATRWRELCSDAALLRIVDQVEVRGVPEDHFDEYLLAHCQKDWQTWTRVAGPALFDLWNDHHHVDTLFLQWRLRMLAEQEKIIVSGDIAVMPDPTGEPVLLRSA